MPEQQQKDVQSQKSQVPPSVSGGANKEAGKKPESKMPLGQDQKNPGAKDEEDK